MKHSRMKNKNLTGLLLASILLPKTPIQHPNLPSSSAQQKFIFRHDYPQQKSQSMAEKKENYSRKRKKKIAEEEIKYQAPQNCFTPSYYPPHNTPRLSSNSKPTLFLFLSYFPQENSKITMTELKIKGIGQGQTSLYSFYLFLILCHSTKHKNKT